MTNQEKKLLTAIRECYLALRHKGHNQNSELAEMVIERFPGVIAEYQDRMIRSQIAKLANHIRKSEANTLKSPQWRLPLEINHLKLPSDISVPSPDGEPEGEWIQLEEATVGELSIHLSMLDKQIKADTKRFSKLTVLFKYLKDHMTEEQEEWAIGLILKDLAEHEELAAE